MVKGFIAQKSLEDAALYRLFVYSQDEDAAIAVEQAQAMFDTKVSAKRISLALDELARKEFVEHSVGSQYVDDSYSISRKGYMRVEDELAKPDSFIAQYALQGDVWLAVNIVAPGVPASDRIVSRDDNSTTFEQLEASLDALSVEVEKSNSIEEEIGDPKDVVLGEIDASKTMLVRGRFRLKRLLALLVPLLSKLADKFSSSAIGHLAKQLMDELMKLL